MDCRIFKNTWYEDNLIFEVTFYKIDGKVVKEVTDIRIDCEWWYQMLDSDNNKSQDNL
ncbi:MAG: hypothetical protein U5L76_05695 [Patescibacteria group bacterium]|nr:hypothetical protein [Patescibacteria group bacterium]